jgi:cardiolipin synthase
MSIPNMLTVIRILLTPVFVIAIIKHAYILALIIFAVAAITDALDGLIARYLNQRTELGAQMDPIADKLLLSSAYVCLAIINQIPNWLTVIVISRDVIILMGMSICYISEVHVPINPSFISKATTLFQLLTITIALFSEYYPLVTILNIFCWMTALLTIISGLHYVFIGMKLLHEEASSENIES